MLLVHGSTMTCGWLAVGVTNDLIHTCCTPRIPGCRSGPMQTPCALTAWSLDFMHQMPQTDTNVAEGVALASRRTGWDRTG